ncbi:hypothetical protein ISF_06112 [Cordyceps fumosorosea ARSEF 2679]|uniref:Uncharacterized protein n=1 Tax=Cordyceps fumosorosea (strain ARSEF 2679) TaxID=1081104 RepID=A0A167SZU2_CORFA|nr:hypothetical protein ISF_06112 [Cordyceps fumosorosea ARSEF 2679]OAA60101.1 hypothetical protein ISF_06112 [Cordyceps fumosorosea ARSEF 2679]
MSGPLPKPRLRGGLIATAFGAVIIVGSLTGAQLKSDQQKTESIKQFRADSPAQQIAILEEQRKHLVLQSAQIDRKMQVFQERLKEREEEKTKRQR